MDRQRLYNLLGVGEEDDLTNEELGALVKERLILSRRNPGSLSGEDDEFLREVRKQLKDEVTDKGDKKSSKKFTSKFLGLKPKDGAVSVGQKLLTGSKEQKQAEEEQKEDFVTKMSEALFGVAASLNGINKSLMFLLGMEKSAAQAEKTSAIVLARKQQEQKAKRTDKKEEEKEKAEMPKIPFMEKIKRFLTNVALGSLAAWLSKPENKSKIDYIFNFLEEHGGKILTALVALLALDIALKIGTAIFAIRAAVLAAKNLLFRPKPTPDVPTTPGTSTPKPPKSGSLQGSGAAPKPRPGAGTILGPKGKPIGGSGVGSYRGGTPARAPSIPRPGQGITPRTPIVPGAPKIKPGATMVAGMIIDPIFNSLIQKPLEDAIQQDALNRRLNDFKKLTPEEQLEALKRLEEQIQEDQDYVLNDPRHAAERVIALGGTTSSERKIQFGYKLYQAGAEIYNNNQSQLPQSEVDSSSVSAMSQETPLTPDQDQQKKEVNHLGATPPPFTEPTAEELKPELKPEKPTDTTPEFQQLMQNKPVAPETQKILEGLFPPQKVSSVSQYGDLQTALGTGNYNTAGSSASQEDAPVFSPVDPNNINVAMVSGIYNSPVAV